MLKCVGFGLLVGAIRGAAAACTVGENGGGWQARVDLTREECEAYCMQHRNEATGDWSGVRSTPWDCASTGSTNAAAEFRYSPQGCLVHQATDGSTTFYWNSLVSGRVCGENGYWCVQCLSSDEVGTCENGRDNSNKLQESSALLCYDQLQGSYGRASCTNYIKWKDCDRSCNLCACSTQSLESKAGEHCSGHGVCQASSCSKLTCLDPRCVCDEGWRGNTCADVVVEEAEATTSCEECAGKEAEAAEALAEYVCQKSKPNAPGPDNLDFKNNPNWAQQNWDLGCTGADAAGEVTTEAACRARCQSYDACCKKDAGCGEQKLAPQISNFCSGGSCCSRGRQICEHGCTAYFRA